MKPNQRGVSNKWGKGCEKLCVGNFSEICEGEKDKTGESNFEG